MNKIFYMIGVTTLLSTQGCGNAENIPKRYASPSDRANVPSNSIRVPSRYWDATDVTEIVLSDGTKCAVLIGAVSGAISCNWKQLK